jgi:hypothetical protein
MRTIFLEWDEERNELGFEKPVVFLQHVSMPRYRIPVE